MMINRDSLHSQSGELKEVAHLMTESAIALESSNDRKVLARLSRKLREHYGLAERYPMLSMTIKPLKQQLDIKEKGLKVKA